MPLVAPVSELVDNAVIQALFHSGIRPLFRILIGRTEFTGTVAAVDGFQVYHIGMRDRIAVHKIFNIILL